MCCAAPETSERYASFLSIWAQVDCSLGVHRFERCCLVGVTVLGILATGSSAQPVARPAASQRAGTAELLAVNVGLSAITSGVVSLVRHGSFRRGILGGAVGGGLGFLGKLVAVDPSVGAPFVGRQIGAIGASLTRSAALGDPFFDQVVLPVGPLRLYLNPKEPGTTTVRVDLESVVWTAYGLLADRFSLDVGKSLSTGAFVFTSSDRLFSDVTTVGRVGGGNVFLDRTRADAVLYHEAAHLLQIDYLKISLGEPLERWIAGGTKLNRVPVWSLIDLGVADYPMRLALGPLMETEAKSLEP